MALAIWPAVGAGFRLIGRRPLSVIAWGAFYYLIMWAFALIEIGVLALFGGGASLGSLMQLSSNSPLAITSSWPVLLASWLTQPTAGVMIQAATLRAFLIPDDKRFFSLRVGRRELSLLLLILLTLVTLGPALLLAAILVAVIFQSPGGIGPLVAVPLGVVAATVATWVSLRLSMAGPMTFAEARVRLSSSWKLTRGSGWRLLGLAAVLLAILAGMWLVDALAIGVVVVLGTNSNYTMASLTAIVGIVSGVLLQGPFSAITLTPWAHAYQQLRSPTAEQVRTTDWSAGAMLSAVRNGAWAALVGTWRALPAASAVAAVSCVAAYLLATASLGDLASQRSREVQPPAADFARDGASVVALPDGELALSAADGGTLVMPGGMWPKAKVDLADRGRLIAVVDTEDGVQLQRPLPASGLNGFIDNLRQKIWAPFGAPLARAALSLVSQAAPLSLPAGLGGQRGFAWRDGAAAPTGAAAGACDGCPEMIDLTSGVLLMGSPWIELGRHDDEARQLVTVSAFSVSRDKITYAEWQACFAAGACRSLAPPAGARPQDPLNAATWADAQAYIAWLSKTTGQPYRLPTEAEWEFAARGGSTDARVSSPNSFGLLNFEAGPAEWVSGCFEPTAGVFDNSSVAGDGSTCRRVTRGGAEGRTPVRLAARSSAAPSHSGGFRVVSGPRWTAAAWPDDVDKVILLESDDNDRSFATLLAARLGRDRRYRVVIAGEAASTQRPSEDLFDLEQRLNPDLVITLGAALTGSYTGLTADAWQYPTPGTGVEQASRTLMGLVFRHAATDAPEDHSDPSASMIAPASQSLLRASITLGNRADQADQARLADASAVKRLLDDIGDAIDEFFDTLPASYQPPLTPGGAASAPVDQSTLAADQHIGSEPEKQDMPVPPSSAANGPMTRNGDRYCMFMQRRLSDARRFVVTGAQVSHFNALVEDFDGRCIGLTGDQADLEAVNAELATERENLLSDTRALVAEWGG